MSSTNKITYELVMRHLDEIEQLPPKEMIEWRHKAIAHKDKQYVMNDIDVFKDNPLTVIKIEELIEELIDQLDSLLNIYNIAFNGVQWEKDLPLEGGMQYVMDSIRFRWEYDQGKYN